MRQKKDAMDAQYASRWLDRMRSRNVMPNFHTYNTALACCLDGKLESTITGSKIASEMMADIDRELAIGFKGDADLKSVMPDTYTKTLVRNLMKQLRENWRSGEINMAVAKDTVRVPLLKLIDFDKLEAAKKMQQQLEEAKKDASNQNRNEDDELEENTTNYEDEIEYAAIERLHKPGSRVAEI